MILRRSTSAAAILVMVAVQLPAQEASLILGGVHTRYADTVSGTAGVVGARLGYGSHLFTTAGEAHYTRFTTGEWASQLSGGFLALRGIGRNAAIGVRGNGSYSYLQGDFWSGVAAAGPVLGLAGRSWMLDISGAAGVVRTVYETSDPLATGSLRITRMTRGWQFDARVMGAWVDEVRYADFLLTVSFDSRDFTASVVGGIRAGDLDEDPWVQGRVAWRFTKSIALEAAVGSYPDDVTGFLGGFFVNAGLRVGLVTPAEPSPSRSGVQMEYLSDAEVRVTFTVRDASAVAIAGEWNQWTPTPLSNVSGNQWQVSLPLGVGVYHFSLIVDDVWVVPEGVVALPDDFGGEVGLLVVDRR